MYKYICERCKARLDPGEKCNCEDEEARYLRKFKLTKTGQYEFNFKDRKSTRLNSSHSGESRMPSSA